MTAKIKLPGVMLRGFYTLTKQSYKNVGGNWVPDGEPEKVAEFENLITNQGLNEIGTRSIDSAIIFVHVGSGNAPPQNTDSGLNNLIATTSVQQASTSGAQTLTTPFYVFRRRTARFGIGVAAGNLSEVGVGWDINGNLFSRALIQDAFGNPTTITVLPTEVLDVTYEIRIYPPEVDFSGTLALGNGVTYNVTGRAADIDSSFVWTTNRSGSSTSTTQNRAYNGNITDVLSSPSGASAQGTSQQNAYINNSLQGEFGLFFDLNVANIGGIRSILITTGFAGWQFEFSSQVDETPIPKDETNQFTFGVVYSWARYVA